MFTGLSCKITDKLEHNGTISKSDRALYEYGLRQMFTTLLNILTMLLIGLAMKMVIPAILYTAAYISLRVYAGGYHASTPQRCWMFSAIMLFVVLWILKNVSEVYPYPLMALSLISCVGIFVFSPVEDKHKPLDEAEHRVYRFIIQDLNNTFVPNLNDSLSENDIYLTQAQYDACIMDSFQKGQNIWGRDYSISNYILKTSLMNVLILSNTSHIVKIV